MMLAQGVYWRVALGKSGDSVVVSTQKELPPETTRGVELEVPLARWAEVARALRPDRKLLGGVLLRYVREEHEAHLSEAVASDRLFGELQRVLQEATLALVEEGTLQLTAGEEGEEPS